MQVGHTFLLNTKYSEPLKATLKNHKQVLPLTMGCFGLGISRIITSAIDILSINKQIRWPKKLAPYTVCIIPPKVTIIKFYFNELVKNMLIFFSRVEVKKQVHHISQKKYSKGYVN